MFTEFLQKIGYSSDKLDQIEKLENTFPFTVNTCEQIFSIMFPEIVGREALLSVIFSSIKRFDVPPFNNIELQKRGIHVFRIYCAYRLLNDSLDPIVFGSFMNIGCLKFEDIFDKRTVDRILEEFEEIDISVNKQSFNLLRDRSGFEEVYARLFNCVEPYARNKTEFRQLFNQNTFFQKVYNIRSDGDNQKNLHNDTFFPAIKFWYFPEEVTIDDGPLTYVPYSCNLNENLLDWHYQQSILASMAMYPAWKGVDHLEGSFRIGEDELLRIDSSFKITPIVCEANTLIIANVFGFHSRGEVSTEHLRKAIHGSIRSNEPLS